MVNVRQLIWSFVASQQVFHNQPPTKSIAIVGGGTAGLAMLKTLLDLPISKRRHWEIVLFEQREDIGGIWLPEPNPPSPPELPKTPLYPLLRTNTPVPIMTYPHFPFPQGTPLYPHHEYIYQYHQDYVKTYGLQSYIRLNHTIQSSSWVGTTTNGYWNITIQTRGSMSRTLYKSFDHLVVASGNNHFPRLVSWAGEDDWLTHGTNPHFRREIIHSVWYRVPERYTNRSVVIVGAGASGRDAASQVAPVARQLYLSVRTMPDPDVWAPPDNVIFKPEISYFTPHRIVFKDGSSASADSVILATGYEVREPFLDSGHALVTDPSAHDNTTWKEGLVTNLRYLFPLYRHTISLCPSHPPNALSFIGLPIFVANAPSNVAQSMLAAHAILNPGILLQREELLAELAVYEEDLRQQGYDPYYVGHRLLNDSRHDYQDGLIEYLKDRGAIPRDGRRFTEQWRRDISRYSYLKRGWQRIEALGAEEDWLRDVSSEDDWADLMRRVNNWQRDWENQEGIPFVDDYDLTMI